MIRELSEDVFTQTKVLQDSSQFKQLKHFYKILVSVWLTNKSVQVFEANIAVLDPLL